MPTPDTHTNTRRYTTDTRVSCDFSPLLLGLAAGTDALGRDTRT